MPVSKNTRKNGKKSKTATAPVSKHDLMRDLKAMDRASQKMINDTAQFAPFLVNNELVNAGDSEKIQDNSAILSRDMIQLKIELEDIRKQCPTKLNAKNADDVVTGLRLGELYTEWNNKYERVILPTIQCLGELFMDASKNLEANKTSPDVTEEK